MSSVARSAVLFLTLVLLPAPARAQDTAGTKPPDRDGVIDGLTRGAAIGALAALPLGFAQMNSCGTGCDWSSTPGVLLGWALIGAAGGSVVGFAADLDAPRPLSVRVGAAYAATVMTSSALSGSKATPTLVAAVQISRHFTVHMEFVRVGHRFSAAAGAVPDEVLRNIVTDITHTRVAGRSHGVESRRVDYVLTQLAGFRVAPVRGVSIEFLAGVGVQGEEERAYYDAHRGLPDGRTVPMPGKYYVLDFATPEAGLVLGVEAEVGISGGVSLIPTLRYHAFENSSASVAVGAGIHWRVRR